MRIHYLQHVPYEGLGSTAEWAGARGHSVAGTRLFEGEALPAPDSFDWLVVMGGPMNIYEEQAYPWFPEEKRFIGEVIKAERTVIGICLGAQLISDVLGGPVVSNGCQEIGWFPLERTAAPAPLEKLLPDTENEAFHWHGDRFELPPGVTPFAESAGCKNQGFVHEGRVWAFQFHPEITPGAAGVFADHDAPLPAGEFVQSREAMLSRPERFERLRGKWFAFLDALAS